jgi:hypothetical protein
MPRGSEVLVDVGRQGLTFRLPTRSPGGADIKVSRSARGGFHRVHARSPDGSTVYVEVLAYPELVPHDAAIAEQQDALRQRAPDARIAGPIADAFHGRPSTGFEFEGTLGTAQTRRRFVFVDTPARTIRIVYDPGSAMNEAILATLRLEQDEG